jgi:hypothetical protein
MDLSKGIVEKKNYEIQLDESHINEALLEFKQVHTHTHTHTQTQ